jgi:hypothetical protein
MEIGQSLIGFWTIVIPSVLVKDRSLLVPLVMLNACLTFSWPNKVPFDREASGTIRAGIYMGARIGADGDMTGARRVSPRAGWVLIPSSWEALGYCGPSLSRDVYLNGVISDL